MRAEAIHPSAAPSPTTGCRMIRRACGKTGISGARPTARSSRTTWHETPVACDARPGCCRRRFRCSRLCFFTCCTCLFQRFFHSANRSNVGAPPGGVRRRSSHCSSLRARVSSSHWRSPGVCMACATRVTRRCSLSCVFIAASVGSTRRRPRSRKPV